MELLCWWQFARRPQLPLLDHMHELDPGFIQPPAGAKRASAVAKLAIEQRKICNDSAVQRRLVDLDAALFPAFSELPIADRIRDMPTDAPENHLTFEMAAFELDHLTCQRIYLPYAKH